MSTFDTRDFQPFTLVCWSIFCVSIIITNSLTVGPRHPMFWAIVAILAMQVGGYIWYCRKWPDRVWRPGPPRPAVQRDIVSPPATKDDLDRMLRVMTWRIAIATLLMMAIIGLAVFASAY